MGNCKACKNMGCAMRGSDWTPNPAIKCYGYRPQTNADRIRAMTDEELADVLAKIVNHRQPSVHTVDGLCLDDGQWSCKDWLSWLKSPVEEVQDGT